MSLNILNLHRLKTKNVGDLLCAPYKYFPDLLGLDAREILGFRSADEPSAEQRVSFKETFQKADAIVVGGGGLLEIDFFQPFFKFLFENRQPNQKIILWGAGHNSWQIGDWRRLKHEYKFDESLFDLIGLRDYNYKYEWVPCASCMHTKFDSSVEITQEIGVYAHSGTIKNKELLKKLPKNFGMIDNNSSFEAAIEFIGSCELLLTDSYHGLYWATLLGRRVIAFPSSSKFYGVRHAVPLCDPSDWKRFEKLAQHYPEALEECRSANQKFASEVRKCL